MSGFGTCSTESHNLAEPTKLVSRRGSGLGLKVLGTSWNMEIPVR